MGAVHACALSCEVQSKRMKDEEANTQDKHKTNTRQTQDKHESKRESMQLHNFSQVARVGAGVLMVLGLAMSNVKAETEEADIAGRQALGSAALGFATLGFAMLST